MIVKRTITLRQMPVALAQDKKYEITKLQNSTDYSIGETLTASQVDALIRAKWTVNISAVRVPG